MAIRAIRAIEREFPTSHARQEASTSLERRGAATTTTTGALMVTIDVIGEDQRRHGSGKGAHVRLQDLGDRRERERVAQHHGSGRDAQRPVHVLDPVEPLRRRLRPLRGSRPSIEACGADRDQRAEDDLHDRGGLRRRRVLRAEVLTVEDEDHQQGEHADREHPAADEGDRPPQRRRHAQQHDHRHDGARARDGDRQAETGDHGNQRRHVSTCSGSAKTRIILTPWAPTARPDGVRRTVGLPAAFELELTLPESDAPGGAGHVRAEALVADAPVAVAAFAPAGANRR